MLVIQISFYILTFMASVSTLSNFDFSKPYKSYELDSRLEETSMLTVDNQNRILTMNDEEGIIFQLDENSGQIINKFQIGEELIKADFEAIASAHGFLYSMTSDGNLYELKIDENEKYQSFNLYNFTLPQFFEIEGMCFNKRENKIIFVLKYFNNKKQREYRPVYSFDIEKKVFLNGSFFEINTSDLKKDFKVESFYPSGMEYIEETDSYLILASKKDKLIVEVSSDGEILDVVKLKKKYHRKPEGIILYKEQIIISDEAKKAKPLLSFYHRK